MLNPGIPKCDEDLITLEIYQGSHRVWKTGEQIMVREKSGNFILGQKSGKSQGFCFILGQKSGYFFPEWLNAAISIKYCKYR